nr:hypothetical protein [uncultured Tolumonas sp.]
MNSKDKAATILFRIFVGIAALMVLILAWPKNGQIPYELIVLGALFLGYALGGDKLAILLLSALGIRVPESTASSPSNNEIKTQQDSKHKPVSEDEIIEIRTGVRPKKDNHPKYVSGKIVLLVFTLIVIFIYVRIKIIQG